MRCDAAGAGAGAGAEDVWDVRNDEYVASSAPE